MSIRTDGQLLRRLDGQVCMLLMLLRHIFLIVPQEVIMRRLSG
jgi:hypothetical protein